VSTQDPYFRKTLKVQNQPSVERLKRIKAPAATIFAEKGLAKLPVKAEQESKSSKKKKKRR